MSVKLSGTLPKDASHNGLDVLEILLNREASDRHLVIAVVDCASTKIDHTDDGDVYTPTAGILFIEAVRDEEDVDAVVEVLGRIRAERVDGGTLDFDFGIADPLAKVGKR